MPKVSVIVPVYQVEAYLSECLDSILAGTFEDYELILVDDGTKDNCPAIMADYAARDARIRLLHNENGGLSSARNAGLAVATGEYVAFVDSDDRVTPDFLADTVRAAEETGAELVLFNYRKFDENGLRPPELPVKDEVLDLTGGRLKDYFYRYWLPYVHGQEAWCRLYRRDVIERNALRFAPNCEVFAEDTLFSAMMLMHTKTLAALKGAYVEYRQRGDSLMAKKKPRLAARLMNLSVRLSRYVRETGHEAELKNVIPVLCYDKLICKGIRYDPSREDVREAMRQYADDGEMRRILHALTGVGPFAAYTLHTGKGWRTQIRGRQFAAAWLAGDIDRALDLTKGVVAE